MKTIDATQIDVEPGMIVKPIHKSIKRRNLLGMVTSKYKEKETTIYNVNFGNTLAFYDYELKVVEYFGESNE